MGQNNGSLLPTAHVRMGVKYLAARTVWRFFITGRPISGAADNATFLHDATIDHRGNPVTKLTRARWRRVARRWAALIVPMFLAVVDWRAAVTYLALGAYVALLYGGMRLAEWWPTRIVEREFVIPTWTVVAKVIGEPPRRRTAVRSVILPAGFGTEVPEDVDPGEAPELTVRIHLPVVPLDEKVRGRVVDAAAARLGLPRPAASWMVRGATAYVDLSPAKFPPRSLTFASVRQRWLDASPTKPFVGMATRTDPVHADLEQDGPHIGLSGPTGTGKSTVLRIILAKRVRAGAGLVVCDYKVTSHPWARRIAGEDRNRVLYLMETEDIHEAILATYAEFERRRGVLKTDPAALATFRDVDLLIEELNTLADMLRKWWGHERRRILAEAKDAGESTPYVPVVPPSVDALAALVQMGRELKMHVHLAAQRLDASAISSRGGGAVRESITNRFLAQYTKQAWNMLCSGVPFHAFPGGPRGIWTAVIGSDVTHFRVPPVSNDEAYALAMGGEPPAGPVLGGAVLVTPYRRAVTRAVTLADAVELIPARPSLDALRKRAQRAGLEPISRQGNADVFDLEALLALYPRVLEGS